MQSALAILASLSAQDVATQSITSVLQAAINPNITNSVHTNHIVSPKENGEVSHLKPLTGYTYHHGGLDQ
jgi:hypothetical protein